MADWERGGYTGNLNWFVRREVCDHMRQNSATKRTRYSIALRLLRAAFANRSFAAFVCAYLMICVALTLTELSLSRFAPSILPTWSQSGPPSIDIKSLLNTVAGYLITAQVGVLGVISIAVGLVTLIAQREGAATDIKVYYHASLAFEVVASCIALLLVLCAQLLWPMQFLLHRFGEGTSLQVFKLILVGIHTGWLCLNLSALAHFVATTFQFVQQSAREQLRERYTANVVFPVELTRRLRHAFYGTLGTEIAPTPNDGDARDSDELSSPSVYFGFSAGEPEIQSQFARPTALRNVHVLLARWAIGRWLDRCQQAPQSRTEPRTNGLANQRPTLYFPVYLDQPLQGAVVWCRRRGGLPLDRLERILLRIAFRFGRTSDES